MKYTVQWIEAGGVIGALSGGALDYYMVRPWSIFATIGGAALCTAGVVLDHNRKEIHIEAALKAWQTEVSLLESTNYGEKR